MNKENVKISTDDTVVEVTPTVEETVVEEPKKKGFGWMSAALLAAGGYLAYKGARPIFDKIKSKKNSKNVSVSSTGNQEVVATSEDYEDDGIQEDSNQE